MILRGPIRAVGLSIDSTSSGEIKKSNLVNISEILKLFMYINDYAVRCIL